MGSPQNSGKFNGQISVVNLVCGFFVRFIWSHTWTKDDFDEEMDEDVFSRKQVDCEAGCLKVHINRSFGIERKYTVGTCNFQCRYATYVYNIQKKYYIPSQSCSDIINVALKKKVYKFIQDVQGTPFFRIDIYTL